METLELLAVGLGLATLAGINLYLTVFLTGLAVRFDWLALADKYQTLDVLADPAVLWVSGILFFLEFFADKVPWVDTLWDSVHTLIRPVGAALVAITVLGESSPAFEVIVGLLGGGMALTAHAAKAGTRMVANLSPEPFSNIGLSLGEDAVVIGGLALVATHPLIAGALAVVAVAVALWLLPGLIRSARATFWFVAKRIQSVMGKKNPGRDEERLPAALKQLVMAWHATEAKVDEALPCVIGRGPGLKRNQFAWAFLTESGEGRRFDLVLRAGDDAQGVEIPHEGSLISVRKGWISDALWVEDPVDRRVVRVLRFDRTRRDDLARLATKLGRRESANLAVPVS